MSKHEQVHVAAEQVLEPVQQGIFEANMKEIVALKSELIDVKEKLEASENKAKDLEFNANEAAREVVKHHTKLQEILNKKDDEIKLNKKYYFRN